MEISAVISLLRSWEPEMRLQLPGVETSKMKPTNKMGPRFLCWYVLYGYLDLVKHYLKPDDKEYDEVDLNTYLMIAILRGHRNIVDYMARKQWRLRTSNMVTEFYWSRNFWNWGFPYPLSDLPRWKLLQRSLAYEECEGIWRILLKYRACFLATLGTIETAYEYNNRAVFENVVQMMYLERVNNSEENKAQATLGLLQEVYTNNLFVSLPEWRAEMIAILFHHFPEEMEEYREIVIQEAFQMRHYNLLLQLHKYKVDLNLQVGPTNDYLTLLYGLEAYHHEYYSRLIELGCASVIPAYVPSTKKRPYINLEDANMMIYAMDDADDYNF